MTDTAPSIVTGRRLSLWGPVLLLVATAAGLWVYVDGLGALLAAWQTPEYSHGPVIPLLSAFLFLRQLDRDPPLGDPTLRWPGAVLATLALALGVLASFAGMGEVVAYALIVWVGGLVLVTLGWRHGRRFWPAVLHLVYMLPLPGILYYKLSLFLQLLSSRMGVWTLDLLGVPVFLDGNIIDLGVLQLQVAEACSGLRYLFPILSFSYVFAVLYRGPVWHRAVLLLAAVPITVGMNALRIALAGLLVQWYGAAHLEGLTHFFEGWVVFLASVLILFAIAAVLLRFQPRRMRLGQALDLDFAGVLSPLKRVLYVPPRRALAFCAVLALTLGVAQNLVPSRAAPQITREPFALFPMTLDEWRGQRQPRLDPEIAESLGADDYFGALFFEPATTLPVELFAAYYDDQTQGGIHSPEICLPGGGWEIAALDRIDLGTRLGLDTAFAVNRVIVQKGAARQLVYYWFEQHGRRVALDYAAKAWLLWDGLTIGRTDGALMRLTTPIDPHETPDEAEARLNAFFRAALPQIQTYVPGL